MTFLYNKAFFRKIIIIVLTLAICIISNNNATSQNSFNSPPSKKDIEMLVSKLNNKIIIGVRDAAYPIGHDIYSTSADGFCGVFG